MASGLISRGWVYQETLLTPANLFCTKQQMWWSCSSSTCSEIWPEYTPQLKSDLEKKDWKLEPPFWDGRDSIRRQKVALTRNKDILEPKSLLQDWTDMLTSYANTSVTFADDRVVALAGVAGIFRSLFPEFQHVTYHSGVWSGDHILEQILWQETKAAQPFSPHRINKTQYYLPSWSPLSSTRPHYPSICKTRWQLPPPQDAKFSEIEGLDQFGRATSPNARVLHLRGVLVPFRLLDIDQEPPLNPIVPIDQVGDHFSPPIFWDNEQEQSMAQAAIISKDDKKREAPSYLRNLICFVDFMVGARPYEVSGLALRPCDEGYRINGHQVWSRCGLTSHYLRFDSPKKIMEHLKAYRVEEYGHTWLCERPEEMNEEEQKWKRQSTGVTPQLQDIYIV